LWFSVGEFAKIAFLFLGAFFYVIILVRSAVAGVSLTYLQIAQDLGASQSQQIFKVLLPGALPSIFDSIIVANGLMWTYIVLAEFINSSQSDLGLGYLIYIGSRLQNSSMLYAGLVTVGILSALTDFTLGFLKKRIFNWSVTNDLY
jgi:ABC-type nitrate/sulfonate/bicarbonate transport system permease component